MPTVIIVDQHLFAEGVATILQQIGISGVTCLSTNACLSASQNALVLVELFLPGNQCGLRFVQQLQQSRPDLTTILWTMHPKPLHIWAGMEYKVPGFLDKAMPQGEFIYWLNHASATGAAWPGSLLAQARQWDDEVLRLKSLSPELWLLWLELLREKNIKDLALQAGWSKRTLERRISELYTALGVQSRAEAVNMAWRYALVEHANDDVRWCSLTLSLFIAPAPILARGARDLPGDEYQVQPAVQRFKLQERQVGEV